MREFEINPHLEKILIKLSKKDKFTYKAILNKIKEIVNADNVDHYKNLRHSLKDRKKSPDIKKLCISF